VVELLEVEVLFIDEREEEEEDEEEEDDEEEEVGGDAGTERDGTISPPSFPFSCCIFFLEIQSTYGTGSAISLGAFSSSCNMLSKTHSMDNNPSVLR